ncbi:Importin N-terminal domain-containing protein [Citrus sinensis]|uniref:Importin N-terminal domain-containing protein n=1 Tax=Citrus sinensis TaxID=2711 RepID=A0ACB8KDZ8_CITSI|nr:Importin N-terminal domain-containing protein [Citrus sinensis]
MESLAQLEALCERLYNSQDSVERAHAENTLKCFSVNTDYISQCQFILDNALTPYALMLASSSLLKQVTEHSLALQLRLDISNSCSQSTCVFAIYAFHVCVSLITYVLVLMFCSVGNYLINYLAKRGPELQSFVTASLIQLLCRLTKFVASRLQELALSLCLKCLSFDFVGTSIDESSEEFGTVQIPSAWRPVLEDPSTLQIFFDYYAITEAPLSKEALECLVRLASVRRSLFTNDAARSKFLAHLMTGTKEILQTGQGLADHDNYHEYCRLLGRFRVNYQLSELVNVEGYSDWIQLVAEFTLKSLQSWQWASSSVYYLLGLWSRLVTSVPYLKGDAPSLLDEFVPKITEGFITSRFNSVQAGFPDDLSDNPLDNVELLQDQLDCFPYLCRFQERARMQTGDKSEISVIEAKLAWIVHIIAAIVKIKQCTGCSLESQEVLDAELSARVLQLINVTDSGLHSQRYCELSKQRLDRAILTFFQHFRKSYVGDQAMHSSKLYARLSELLGLHDHLLLLNVIVGKIATNLKCYTESQEVIDHTLSLFLELASGLESTPDSMFRTDAVKCALIGLMRDLRGIAMATNRTYGLLFDWLYPAHMPLLLKGISHWTDTPEVTTPLLKFMAEFVLNKAQRLTFDSSSPNGILLFREVSKLIVAYGSRVLSLPNAADIYAYKYKGMWICFTILARALAGNYVNFGVFELYGDRALSDALDIALKMTLSIPLADILAFRKLTKAYFAFLEVLFSSHITFILNLNTNTFMHIVGSLESGLKGLDTNISSQCAAAVDNLAAFYFNNITMGEAPTSPAAINLARHIVECPTLFPEILKTLFEIVLFEDCGNQWSLSRPMLSLILISEQVFSDLKAQILASQPVDQHQRLSVCFDKLMADVARSLDSKNRDKFTQNLTEVQHGVSFVGPA